MSDLHIATTQDVVGGGHNHSDIIGSVRYVAARFSPNYCWTGPSGTSCRVELLANSAGAIVTLSTTIANGPYAGLIFYNPIHISAFGGFSLGTRLQDWQTPDFALIGDTGTHPDNHYCDYDICEKAVILAAAYNAQWARILAYNDCR